MAMVRVSIQPLLVLLAGLSLTGAVQAEPSAPRSHVQTMILDESGAYVESAKIFIYNKDVREFSETIESTATNTMELPPGRYRIYAAVTRHNEGIFEHYASPEANVTVEPGESLSVILALKPVEASEMIVSDSVMEKIKLDPDLINNIN